MEEQRKAGERKVSFVRTEDGSFTLFVPELQEHYHSTHGALAESQHVYVDSGLMAFVPCPKRIKILEVGLGTGLNVLLSFRAVQHFFPMGADYVGLEPFRLPSAIIDSMGYDGLCEGEEELALIKRLTNLPAGEKRHINDKFSLCIEEVRLEGYALKGSFDLIYFDAFAPVVQPELWEEAVFVSLFDALLPGGILVTYCAQGKFKRALKSAGFVVEALPGPKGKREITRARKLG
jgi:tRNA U34 5-methylaminomethyl-2-thiouridine-forming methyltransferase MnmC